MRLHTFWFDAGGLFMSLYVVLGLYYSRAVKMRFSGFRILLTVRNEPCRLFSPTVGKLSAGKRPTSSSHHRIWFDLTSDYGASRWVCQHKRIIIKVWGENSWRLTFGVHCQSFPCTLTSIRTLLPSSNNVVTLPMSQLVFWRVNDFAVAEAEPNAFPLLLCVSAVVTWFRNKAQMYFDTL